MARSTVVPATVIASSLQHSWTGIRLLSFEAARLVLKMLRPALTSGPPAWLLTYSFTLGNIFTGKSPARQSAADFICMTATVSTGSHCVSILAPYALSLRDSRHLDGSVWTFTQLIFRYLQRTWWLYLLAHALALGTAYSIIWSDQAFASEFKPHFYLTCVWNSLYRAGVDEASHSIFQQETAEGNLLGHVNDAPYWKRYVQAVGRAANFTVVAIIAAALVHVCAALDLLQTNAALLLFSVASVVVKTVILSITKRIALQQGGTRLKKIYVLTAVPTVLINTQVRLVVLRCGSGSSILGFLQLGILEPALRTAKLWHLKRAMKELENDQVSSFLPSSSSQMIQDKWVEILDPRESLLHFHAAESHADMCSEYIAIACSTSIFYFLQRHPRFGWGSTTDYEPNEGMKTLVMGLWQLGIEVVVDFLCCLFELANGIPMQDSESLGSFLTAVFTSCAVVSVSISALLCVHEAETLDD